MGQWGDKTSEGLSADERHEAFIRLLTAHHKRIHGFIRAVVPRWSDADDIMQETVMTMWRKFGEFQPETNFAAWGIAIARYAIQKFRNKSAVSMVFSDEALERVFSHYSVMLKDMDERVEALEHCVTLLKDRDRQLVRMRYEQGLRAGAMADRMGLSVHGVYKAMQRIHNMLLRCVRRRLVEMGIS
jgi:RNA polymerase sigma-70 factor